MHPSCSPNSTSNKHRDIHWREKNKTKQNIAAQNYFASDRFRFYVIN